MSTFNAKGRLMSFARPMVMGILNRTPDSFYSGSRVTDDTLLLQQAEQMIREGADILDIGGQRPPPEPHTFVGGGRASRGGGAIHAPAPPQPRVRVPAAPSYAPPS